MQVSFERMHQTHALAYQTLSECFSHVSFMNTWPGYNIKAIRHTAWPRSGHLTHVAQKATMSVQGIRLEAHS